ncbi:hypothetical protein ACHQM5_027069 [Ranunculus cassubicifolius]
MSGRNPVVVSVPSTEQETNKKNHFSFLSLLKTKNGTYDPKQLIHSIKVGIALVLVSLLYLVDPLYSRLGENAMWAIMTVVVLFEFYAGAILSKGFNRGIGTVFGGMLGCFAAILAEEVGGPGKPITIGTSVFIFGAVGSYFRLNPSIKRKYDYGVMIFILTFNLVAVSGLRGEQVIALARERLSTIVMGFIICIVTSLVIFPMWASDELHCSTVAKFECLATSIEGCMEAYFKKMDKEGNVTFTMSDGYKSILYSKSKDETLANFAKWEPWHGKFGFNHPWEKYLRIGDSLRELATYISFLKECLQSTQETSTPIRFNINKSCEEASTSLTCTLRELGQNILSMGRSGSGRLIIARLQSTSLELSESLTASETVKSGDGLEMATFVFMLIEMMTKVEKLVREVEDLADLAGFLRQKNQRNEL